MSEQRAQRGTKRNPLQSERGRTSISDPVVSQIAGIAAQEVEKVQMGGGATAAVGGFLQSVTGGSSANYARGVTVRKRRPLTSRWPSSTVTRSRSSPKRYAATSSTGSRA